MLPDKGVNISENWFKSFGWIGIFYIRQISNSRS
jgi:hypothetical protein